jgi:hypothetical protein
MKKNIACMAGLLLAFLPVAKATTTLTAWTFDNLTIAANGSPQPSTGFGTAGALGMGSGSNPDVQSLAGSSSGGANVWRIRATGAGNGWSTNALIGTQGAKYAGSTAGYYRVKVSFDVYATSDAEANLQIQYTTEGSIWKNATNLASAGSGVVRNNSSNNNTVIGSYVSLASGWNNQITVDLSGISGVDNNPNFAIRMVNASTGTNCLDTTGAVYNNTSGNWTFDNVVIQGVSIDTVTEWTFESYGTTAFVPHPVPEFGSGTATALGFDTTFHFSDGTVGSTNKPDTLVQGGSSTPSGTICWRVRGQGPGNGWYTGSEIGTQGAEFDVSTVNYNDVVISFDLYFTTQAEAKMCVLYTTNNWATTNNASTLAYGANPTFILTNSVSNLDYSPDTVTGTYFYQTTGQNWYNNMIVDFTGVPGVANNPNFGIRIVNAAQNNDCVAFNGGSYNNSSGNCRYDNVTVGGTFNGLIPPVLAYDPSATVDRPFTNTFTDDATWRSKITSIYVNGSILTNSAYTANTPGMIIFTPSQSVLLQSSGVLNIVINAAGYSSAKVTQPLAAGVATKLAITQPAAPSASGGTLIANPVLSITDQYGNGTTNPYPNFSVTASVGGAGGWTLGGATNQAAVNGYAVFTNLSATVNGSSAVSGAVIAFTINGYTNSANGSTVTNFNSTSFNIGAPPVPFTRGNLAVLQIDTVANNTTFSMIEVKPSAANQTSPVNTVPISATGTNALRQSSAGSTGRLALSDDGSLLCFAAFADGSAATPDETFILDRAVGTLNYTNLFTSPAHYTSISLGGSQARACVTVDDVNWIIDDKGGLYYGIGYIPYPNINALNNVVVKSFGGTAYVETQKTANGSPIPVVYALAAGNPPVPVPNNLGTDPIATDFHMISTNGGITYDILYILDQVSSSQGVINKYSWVPDNTQISGYGWAANGSFTNATGGDALFATTNGNNGVYLFFTTGGGGSAGNTIVRVTDASGWNQPMNIISSNVIYKASATTSIKGLTFVPQPTNYPAELIPPPILTAQTFAATNSPFTVTNTPDDPLWRSSITGITVNGSPLPAAAYNTNQPGVVVFDPSQSPLLQGPGTNTIAISATGYSTNSITQIVAGVAAKLALTTQPKAPTADGGPLATQPVVAVQDAFGNAVASSASIVVAPVQGTWTLGGTTTKAAVSGTAKFTNLSAFSASAIAGATISFTASGLTGVTSSSFNIPAPIHSKLGGAKLITGGNLIFSFTNAAGLSFSVLATNNIAAPITNWPVVGSAGESPAGSGNYQFTNSPATNSQFYILRQP